MRYSEGHAHTYFLCETSHTKNYVRSFRSGTVSMPENVARDLLYCGIMINTKKLELSLFYSFLCLALDNSDQVVTLRNVYVYVTCC